MIKLKDIPTKYDSSLKETVSFAVSIETYNKLELIKRKGKNTSALMRQLLEKFLEENKDEINN